MHMANAIAMSMLVILSINGDFIFVTQRSFGNNTVRNRQ